MSELDGLNAVYPDTDEETLAFTSTTHAAQRSANNPKQMAFKRYRHGTFIIGGCIQK
jgi:S-methylmethionine-dependent homocysteine/selenocysteine methylase